MAATVVLLISLVVVVPRLLGGGEDLASLPRLILNFDEDDERLVFFVTSLSGTYLYRSLHLNITAEGSGPWEANASNQHGLEVAISLREVQGEPVAFHVAALAVDRGDASFDLSLQVTVNPWTEAEGWRFELLFGEEAQARIVTDRDLMASPLATLLERRESP